jgi:hypothetical protein
MYNLSYNPDVVVCLTLSWRCVLIKTLFLSLTKTIIYLCHMYSKKFHPPSVYISLFKPLYEKFLIFNKFVIYLLRSNINTSTRIIFTVIITYTLSSLIDLETSLLMFNVKKITKMKKLYTLKISFPGIYIIVL